MFAPLPRETCGRRILDCFLSLLKFVATVFHFQHLVRLPLWQNFKSHWAIFDMVYIVFTKHLYDSGNFLWNRTIFPCCKWPKIEK